MRAPHDCGSRVVALAIRPPGTGCPHGRPVAGHAVSRLSPWPSLRVARRERRVSRSLAVPPPNPLAVLRLRLRLSLAAPSGSAVTTCSSRGALRLAGHEGTPLWATMSPDSGSRGHLALGWGALMAGPSRDVRLRLTRGPSLRVARGESRVTFSVWMKDRHRLTCPRLRLRLRLHLSLEHPQARP